MYRKLYIIYIEMLDINFVITKSPLTSNGYFTTDAINSRAVQIMQYRHVRIKISYDVCAKYKN